MADLSLRILLSAQDQASSIIQRIGSAFGPVGVGLATIGVAAIGAGVAAVKMAGDFQSMTTTLVTGAGESTKNIDMIRKGLLDMSVATGTSVQQLTSGMFMVESAGYHGSEGLKVMQVAAEGAKVGNADLGTVSNALTTVMQDYGIKATDAASAMNFLTGIVQNGKTTMEALSGSMSQVLPTASAVGVHLVDVGAAMATMTSEGVPAANAATYLRQMLISLNAPASSGARSIKDIGLTTQQVSDQMKVSLPDTLKLIMEHLEKTYKVGSPEYVNALKNIAGGSKQMQGMLDLTGAHLSTFSDNMKNVSDVMNQNKGVVAGWADVQQNFNFKLDQAKQAVNALMITVGSKLLPALTPVVDALGKGINALTQLVSGGNNAKGAVHDLGNTLQQVGGIIGRVFDILNGDAMSKVTGAFHQVTPAISGVGDTIHQVFMRIQAVISTINPQAIASGFEHVAQVFLKLSPGVNLFQALSSHAQELGKWFQSSVVPAMQQAAPSFQQLAKAGQQLWPVLQSIANIVHDTFQSAFSALLPVFERAIPLIIQIAGVIAGGLGKAIQFLAPYFVQAAQAVGQFASDIASRVAPILAQFFDNLSKSLNWLQTNWPAIWKVIGPIVKGAWDEIVGVIKIAWAIITGIIKIGLDLLSGNWKQAWTDFKTMLSGVWDGIKQYLTGAWEIIKGIASAEWNAIVNAVKGPVQGVGSWLSGIWEGIRTNAVRIWNGLVDGIKTIVLTVTTWLQQTWQNAVTTVVGWFNWLYNHNYYFKDLVDTIRTVITGAVIWLTSTWSAVTRGISVEWQLLTAYAHMYWSLLVFVIQMYINQAVTWLQGTWNTVISWLRNTWNTIVTDVTAGWNKVSSIFASAWGTYISGPLGNLWKSITDWFQHAVDGFLAFGSDIMHAVARGISGAAGAVGDAIHSAIGGALSALGFHGIPGFASGIENFGGGLAYVHAGEVLTYLPKGASVIPANQVRSMMGGPSGGTMTNISRGPTTVNIHVNMQGTGNTGNDANQLAALLGDHLRAQFGNI